MPGPVFVEGADVTLRTIETDDADFLQQLINDASVRTSLHASDAINHTEEQEWIESLGKNEGVHPRRPVPRGGVCRG